MTHTERTYDETNDKEIIELARKIHPGDTLLIHGLSDPANNRFVMTERIGEKIKSAGIKLPDGYSLKLTYLGYRSKLEGLNHSHPLLVKIVLKKNLTKQKQKLSGMP